MACTVSLLYGGLDDELKGMFNDLVKNNHLDIQNIHNLPKYQSFKDMFSKWNGCTCTIVHLPYFVHGPKFSSLDYAVQNWYSTSSRFSAMTLSILSEL